LDDNWINQKLPFKSISNNFKELAMNRLRILITVLAIAAFGLQEGYAQERDANKDAGKEEVRKTTKDKTPVKVKESLKDYSNYKVADEVTYVKKNDTNIYKFKVEKGQWSHYLLINESGKIIGIETGEH